MSLINNTPQRVKFISYTGKYPNLCSGVLTLENDGNYEAFWSSGGGCGFYNDYANAYVDSGAWEIDVSALPEELRPFAAEIDEVFNDNVPQGCCGGCL
ncbi:MAG: hypothetical protein K1W18_07150 [Oscillospiraceae bacterium]